MSLVEAPFSNQTAPLPTTRSRLRPLSEAAPCFKPFGKEKVSLEGSVFELPSDSDAQPDVLAVVKRSPDQQRVTAINNFYVVRNQKEGDAIWVLPNQPGKEDRSKRFRFTVNRGIEISLFNGSSLQTEYDLETGKLTSCESIDHTEAIPQELPPRGLSKVLDTMGSLVAGESLTLTDLQSLANFTRDHKLEGF